VPSCPFCGSSERREHGGRPEAGCVGCGSLERHRALAGRLGPELEPRASARCLELAPRSAEVFGGHLRRRGWEYVGVDRYDLRGASEPTAFATFIGRDVDATDLAFAATGSYELFITQHVIEQVADYPAALDEAARVLERDGRALLEIPWQPRLAHSRRRRDRNRHGSLWEFGADLPAELEARFESVERVVLEEGQYHGEVFVCRRGERAMGQAAAFRPPDRSSSSS
jgi:SAM-dependent methyltransferase